MRVLRCPNGVLRGVECLTGVRIVRSQEYDAGVECAYLPELNLSNKAAELMSEAEHQEKEARNITNVAWTKPLLEVSTVSRVTNC